MNPHSIAQDLFRLLQPLAVEAELSPERWQQVLAFADRTHLTLHLRGLALPREVELQIEERWKKNECRRVRLRNAFLELSSQFSRSGIDYVLLKGFTHEIGFGLAPGSRVQSDLDFLVSPQDRNRASDALRELGYRPHGPSNLSAEHGRPWVRPFDWTWRGDYFDPEMPIPVELHDSVWSAGGDRIPCPGLDHFWNRRALLSAGEMEVRAFRELDRIAFAALHALRHILRNDARPAHVFELARLLHSRVQEESLWTRWLETHSPRIRRLQAVAFRFSKEWFDCDLPEPVARECESLPQPVKSWFDRFSWSPIQNLAHPNKDVLWLHLALIESSRDRWQVAVNRLFPLRRPHEKLEARLRYHASALFPALRDGMRWWLGRTASSTASHTSD